MTDQALPSGFQIGGYEIASVLGQGGFGITYLARVIAIPGKYVAIKEFFPEKFASRKPGGFVLPDDVNANKIFEWGMDRFSLEAQILHSCQHANIVNVSHVLPANKTLYMVMDYVQGVSFKKWVDENRPLSQASLAPILTPLIDGLKLVHSKNLLHRDIKPENIIISEGGKPVLIDFGAAREFEDNNSVGLTSMWSNGYSPIEQRGDPSISIKQGAYSDIYALSATMYFAMTGQPPSDAGHRKESLDSLKSDQFVPVQERAEGDFDNFFCGAINWALSYWPEERPQTLAEWSERLFAGSRNSSAGSKPSPEPDDIGEDDTIKSSYDSQSAPREEGGSNTEKVEKKRNHRLRYFAAAAVILVIVAGLLTHEIRQFQLFTGSSIVDISSEPPGAEIILDGIAIGKTPFFSDKLAAGTYSLTLDHPSSEGYTAEVELINNRTFGLNTSLEPASGSLTVLSQPSGAEVLIGDKVTSGTTPITLDNLPAGAIEVSVRKDGYHESTRTVLVAKNDISQESYALIPIKYGTALININQDGALVNIEGTSVEYKNSFRLDGGKDADLKLSSRRLSLPVGDYKIIVSKKGFLNAAEDISITEGKLIEQKFTLLRDCWDEPILDSVCTDRPKENVILELGGSSTKFQDVTDPTEYCNRYLARTVQKHNETRGLGRDDFYNFRECIDGTLRKASLITSSCSCRYFKSGSIRSCDLRATAECYFTGRTCKNVETGRSEKKCAEL